MSLKKSLLLINLRKVKGHLQTRSPSFYKEKAYSQVENINAQLPDSLRLDVPVDSPQGQSMQCSEWRKNKTKHGAMSQTVQAAVKGYNTMK